MKRIILHWSAGTHTPSALDKEHYHFIIDGAGKVHPGKWPVSANEKIVGDNYAAHTKGTNTGSIGVAVAAMAGATDRPFSAGKYPITTAQVEALVTLCRKLMKQYGIAATRQTVLSHAEVQPTLGIKQSGKWDIAWLPGMPDVADPVKVGDRLRALINDAKPLAPKPVDVSEPPFRNTKPKPAPVGGIIGAIVALIALIAAAFGWKG